MNTNILEFLGQAFLNAARSQQQMEDMNKYFGQNIGADNPFVRSLFKSFGWQHSEKNDADDILEFTQKTSAAYKELFKVYLTMFDVVSREEHLRLIKENNDLKARIDELEKNINSQSNISDKDNFDPEKIVDNLTQIMKNQTQQFQELMKQLNQPYKKGTTTKTK
jgi:BMFP domain-containing protein YqiC